MNKINKINKLRREDLILSSRLGKGTYGTVYKAYNINTSYPAEVAIKIIDKDQMIKYGLYPVKIAKEIEIMQKLDHPFIVKFYTHFYEETQILHVYEYLPGGDLYDLTKNGGLGEDRAFNYFQSLAAGLKYLHDSNIIHRDIKAENILIDQYDNPKIIDFGFADTFTKYKKFDDLTGTLFCMAPEMFAGPYDYRIDIWMLGIVLYEMLVGYPPFHSEDNGELVSRICDMEPLYPDVSEPLLDILKWALAKDPEERLTLEYVVHLRDL